MRFLYIDESGSNTSHFVLLGVSIPANCWRIYAQHIADIKKEYALDGKEIHTGWLLKRLFEQSRVQNFESLSYDDRRTEVEKVQRKYLNKYATLGDRKKTKSKKKEIQKVRNYIHLSFNERKECVEKLADVVGSWNDCRLFCESVERNEYDLQIGMFENSFTQVISRFDNYLRKLSKTPGYDFHGIVIQDMNDSVCHQLRALMKEFHNRGTIWSRYTRIIETPFFVDSQLTSMIQMADLCAYITRRFFENNETMLFDKIYNRFDRIPAGKLTGLRHYTGQKKCSCKVCVDHNR